MGSMAGSNEEGDKMTNDELREILEHLKLIEPGAEIPAALIRQAR